MSSIECVQVKGLGKRYGLHRALAGVDLELHGGEVCALLGPNGAGKSTFLGILSSLVRPTKGAVRFVRGGGEVNGADLRREIGVLAHESFLYSGLTALENLAFWGRLYGGRDVRERSEQLLCAVGLEPKAWDRTVGTYSRGMVQRLAVARALFHEPSVLLLDEPFTGLDRTGAQSLTETIAGAASRRCIVLIITHDLESIANITRHVAILKNGKLAHEARSSGYSFSELKEIYHSHTDEAALA